MRTILFSFLLIPALSNAQFKRSATELAKDRIRDYITEKLFKNASYEPITYGDLIDNKVGRSNITSLIRHKFSITEMQAHDNIKAPVQKEYVFIFYFNDKMKVQMAEGVSSE